MPPYSSSTIASENLPRCISRNSSEMRLFSGTWVTGRMSERSETLAIEPFESAISSSRSWTTPITLSIVSS